MNTKLVDLLKSEDVCTDVPTDVELQQIDEEKMKLQERLRSAKQRRYEAQKRRSVLSKEFHHARLVREAISERINALSYEHGLLKDRIESMEEESVRVSVKLKKYMQMNAINDSFYIWYSGPFGTINNFRVGDLKSTIKPIDWTEINAGLGQAVLALSIIAAKAGFDFKKYILSPMGSFSKVFKADDRRNALSLFVDGQLFYQRNFNAALTGFLTCVQELGDFIRSKDPTRALPYAININEGKIFDQSFALGSDEEMWTRALKFLLTDIKWIIAWATKHCNTASNVASKPALKSK